MLHDSDRANAGFVLKEIRTEDNATVVSLTAAGCEIMLAEHQPNTPNAEYSGWVCRCQDLWTKARAGCVANAQPTWRPGRHDRVNSDLELCAFDGDTLQPLLERTRKSFRGESLPK